MQHITFSSSSSIRPDGCDLKLVNDDVALKQCQVAEKSCLTNSYQDKQDNTFSLILEEVLKLVYFCL